MQPYERKFPISKDVLDIINSLSWFAMDAAWMIQFPTIASILSPIVLLSAFCLTYLDKRKNIMYINLAIVAWILMNISWMVSEVYDLDIFTHVSRSFFLLGVLFILLATKFSPNLKETFSHFRRFRLLKRP